MDVFTAISQRSSVRAYKDTDIGEEKLKKILEAARLSPSSSNRQEWKFIVVKNKETRKSWPTLPSDSLLSQKHLSSSLLVQRNRSQSWPAVNPLIRWMYPSPARL